MPVFNLDPFFQPSWSLLRPQQPLPIGTMDIIETEKTYKILMDVPGVKKEQELSITIQEDVLTISGERKRPAVNTGTTTTTTKSSSGINILRNIPSSQSTPTGSALTGTVSPAEADAADDDSSYAGYLINERPYGKFSRSIRLPKDVNVDDVHARVDLGVLEIVLGKVTSDQRSFRRVIKPKL
ncbi:hypothetical protein HDU76_005235 [Blyttiomyces sp. JEL0837]|nr:hypothetical protein HDU76_005235 [Blyttiomyces sp. JEL0837]